jgi:hypothetical protein
LLWYLPTCAETKVVNFLLTVATMGASRVSVWAIVTHSRRARRVDVVEIRIGAESVTE